MERWTPAVPLGVACVDGVWLAHDPISGKPMIEGFWTFDGLRAMTPAGVQCPYCRDELQLLAGNTIARIVKVDMVATAAHGKIQFLPDSLDALGCLRCIQVFTVPKRKIAEVCSPGT